ncbi:zf-HC2 domain-containing protein [Streptomyces sp. NPDC094448]|uniref:zf-HC2 domain-containing protein n=1 Tax=Streptomyces sp. NPDC094448 TaxID=3366063 RepID=UPI0038241D73
MNDRTPQPQGGEAPDPAPLEGTPPADTGPGPDAARPPDRRGPTDHHPRTAATTPAEPTRGHPRPEAARTPDRAPAAATAPGTCPGPETARGTGPRPDRASGPGAAPGSGARGGRHIGQALAAAYARGTVREPDAWSLEKHLESCGACAGVVSAAVRETAAGTVVADVRASVLGAVGTTGTVQTSGTVRTSGAVQTTGTADARPAVSLGRLRNRDHRSHPAAGRSPHGSPAGPAHGRPARLPRPGAIRTGLLRTVGPALSRGWLGALAAVVAGAFAVSYGTGSEAARPLLLALAPALPPAGVALSYGRHADPLHEIAAATPSGGLRLLLTRSAAVLALSVTLLTAAGALLPADGGAPGAATWLLPALALTAGALALGTWTGLRTAAAALAGGWLAVALYPAAGSSPGGFGARLAPLLSGTAAQTGWAAAAALCTGLLVLRRTTFDQLEKA